MYYNKATYVNPYIEKFIRTLGIENIGTLKKPKMNVIYAILANNEIKPIGKNKYGTPFYQHSDLDGLNDRSIIAGFEKWKDDVLRKDIEMSIRDGNTPKPQPKQKQADTQLSLFSEMKFNDSYDDKLYSDLFGKKVFLTEKQVEELKNKLTDDKYIENDFHEKWLREPTDSDVFQSVKKKLDFKNKSNFGLMDVAKVVGGEEWEKGDKPYYIAIIHGGLNGPGNWEDYLDDFKKIIKALPKSYFIGVDVDVPDDVWTIQVGFKKEELNEGASGYQPEDSDNYFDYFYELSKLIFNNLLEHLDKNLKTKNDNSIYTYLGMINHLLQVYELTMPIRYNNKDLKNKNTEKLGVKLIEKCIKCYNYLSADKENRQGWKDFEEYKDELRMQYEVFKRSMKLLNDDANVDTYSPFRHLHESSNYVDTNKVLLLTNYLDNNFVRAKVPIMGTDGYPSTKEIVGMKGTDGQIIRNMSAKQLFYLLQDKFKGIYDDKKKRDALIKQTMIDWYNRKVSKDGLLSKNMF